MLGVSLQQVNENPGLRITDLTQVGRLSVQGDAQPTTDLSGARATIERLRTEELLPVCAVVQPVVPAPVTDPAAPPAAAPTTTSSPQVPGRDCRQVQ